MSASVARSRTEKGSGGRAGGEQMENSQGLSPRVFGKRAQGDLGKAPGLQQAYDKSKSCFPAC